MRKLQMSRSKNKTFATFPSHASVQTYSFCLFRLMEAYRDLALASFDPANKSRSKYIVVPRLILTKNVHNSETGGSGKSVNCKKLGVGALCVVALI